MFVFKSFYSFMYPVLVVWGLGCCAGCSPAVASGGGRAAALQLWRGTSRSTGSSRRSARAAAGVAHGLGSCSSQTLEHRLSRCGALAELLLGMWELPGQGIEPVSPALVGKFFTAEPPGKPSHQCFKMFLEVVFRIFPLLCILSSKCILLCTRIVMM